MKSMKSNANPTIWENWLRKKFTSIKDCRFEMWNFESIYQCPRNTRSEVIHFEDLQLSIGGSRHVKVQSDNNCVFSSQLCSWQV